MVSATKEDGMCLATPCEALKETKTPTTILEDDFWALLEDVHIPCATLQDSLASDDKKAIRKQRNRVSAKRSRQRHADNLNRLRLEIQLLQAELTVSEMNAIGLQ